MPITQGTSQQLGSAILASTGATALWSDASLPLLCDILENQGIDDSMGGQLDDWQPIESNVPCKVEVKTPVVNQNDGDKITAIGIYEFTLPASVTIAPWNRIRFYGSIMVIQDREIDIPTAATIQVRCRLVE